MSNAVDVNGDGVDDLIIGAKSAGPNGNDSGESYVVFGGTTVSATGTVNLAALDGNNGFVLNGVGSKDYSGFSVSAAGDVNGDGIDDLIIGARGGEGFGLPRASRAAHSSLASSPLVANASLTATPPATSF